MDHHDLPHHHHESHNTLRLAPTDFRTVADLFRLMGDSTRVRIFWLLCHCQTCVINLSALLDMSSPAVSHHLRELRDSGLIVSRREGKEVHYRAADTPQAQLLHRMIEQVMAISCPERSDHPADDQAIVRAVHQHLLEHMDQRITIDELARQYAINPTTLKSLFKATYGDSIAAHVKEHRMERAAELLRQTDQSIGEIAAQVGYESQSRFSAAFRDAYGVLPTDYRKGE